MLPPNFQHILWLCYPFCMLNYTGPNVQKKEQLAEWTTIIVREGFECQWKPYLPITFQVHIRVTLKSIDEFFCLFWKIFTWWFWSSKIQTSFTISTWGFGLEKLFHLIEYSPSVHPIRPGLNSFKMLAIVVKLLQSFFPPTNEKISIFGFFFFS